MKRDWAARFVDKLAMIRLANTFNPYADTCPLVDAGDAAAVRRANLRAQLRACVSFTGELWVGREPGYRGARRTGLAFTDDANLTLAAERYGGIKLGRATRDGMVRERTAAVVWSMLERCERMPMLWNAFPLHAHEPDQALSNRRHTRAERAASADLFREMLNTIAPSTVIAVGNDAHDALRELGVKAMKVRHPSYGGEAEFRRDIERACRLNPARDLFDEQ